MGDAGDRGGDNGDQQVMDLADLISIEWNLLPSDSHLA